MGWIIAKDPAPAVEKHENGSFLFQPGWADDRDWDVEAVLGDRPAFDVAGRKLGPGGRLGANQDLPGVGG